MVQAVAIGGDARHEDIAGEIAGNVFRGGFHLLRGGAAFPVVSEVVDRVEAHAGESVADGRGVVPVAHCIAHAAAKRLFCFPVEDGDFVIGGEEPLHQKFSNKQRSTDYENAHGVFAPMSPARLFCGEPGPSTN